ncbi:hypothetical protein B7494_g2022 [Chlorociboria aeruginascens]|nr:hypothetical protein B7494_g2022 [Chlorociboria aeruginascens]
MLSTAITTRSCWATASLTAVYPPGKDLKGLGIVVLILIMRRGVVVSGADVSMFGDVDVAGTERHIGQISSCAAPPLQGTNDATLARDIRGDSAKQV